MVRNLKYCEVCGRKIRRSYNRADEPNRLICSMCAEDEAKNRNSRRRESLRRCVLCGHKIPNLKSRVKIPIDLRNKICLSCFSFYSGDVETIREMLKLSEKRVLELSGKREPKEDPKLTRQCYEETLEGYQRPTRAN